jgi:PKD repeat protein
MWDDPGNYQYFIPLIWQGDGPNPSPGYSARGSLYGVSGIPHCQWNGSQNYVGGGASTLPAYINLYNNISALNSPAQMNLELNTNSQGQLAFLLDVNLTGNITTINNQIVWVLTHDWEPGQLPDYFASVILYEQTPFDLTTAGQSGSYEYAINMAPNWDLTKMKAIAMIQTFSGNHFVHQAAITDFSGLLPMFNTNVTQGPAYLGVQFTSNSFPQTGIDLFEWDFDGDGVFDSTGENPFHLYTTPGIYDVTLRITVGGETAETTATGLINVTDGSNIGGNLSGIWLPEFNPYNITADAFIAAGDELSILPGVEINFASGNKLTATGKITADAGERTENPIILSSNQTWAGIRIYNNQQDNIIRGCEISKVSGSAISVENSASVQIIGNRIFDNSSSSVGAAVDLSSSDNVLISQNIIANNTSATLVGGIGAIASAAEISNNIIVNNTGMYGAMSLKNGSDALIFNNTIANNLSLNGTPYQFFIFNAMPEFINNILIDNGTPFFAPFGDPSVTYTCISGGFTGEGNIDEDPLFLDPSAGDGNDFDGLNANWTLLPGSPCIDAGNPDPVYNDPDDSRNDMGAYGGPNALALPVGNDDDPISIISYSNITIYPNPFNPQTTISLSLTEADKQHPVTVGIYNVKGQLVKMLVDNEIVNNTIFVWDGVDEKGSKSASGLYFIKLNSASTNLGKKVLLLK